MNTMIKEYKAKIRTIDLEQIEGTLSINKNGDMYFNGEGHEVFIPYHKIKMIHSHKKNLNKSFVLVEIAWIYEIVTEEKNITSKIFAINTIK
jgi:hypothetical protein